MSGMYNPINGNMEENKFSGYFDYYISRVDDAPLMDVLKEQYADFSQFLNEISEDKLDYAYETNKWTVKEVIFHIIETEIIMLYRAIRISRGDQTVLPGYDENYLVAKARVKDMSLEQLKTLYSNTRQNSLFYFNHMNDDELNTSGSFSDLDINVKKIGYLLGGHLDHHLEILKERYLK